MICATFCTFLIITLHTYVPFCIFFAHSSMLLNSGNYKAFCHFLPRKSISPGRRGLVDAGSGAERVVVTLGLAQICQPLGHR